MPDEESKTVLITGANGQDGHYLTKLCLEQGARVIGIGRTGPDIKLDVTDFNSIENLIRDARPDFIFHLAADSTLSHEALFSNHAAISTGAINILEACWRHCRLARVFLPGSAMQFSNTGEHIDESTPFESNSPYAAARIYTTYLARYFRSLGLHCYVGYLFHHDSPMRQLRHMSQKIARAAARLVEGNGEQITLGSLSVEKEWTFAGDTVRAMWILVNQDVIYEAVIGSGCAYPVQNWVEACFNAVGIEWELWVKESPGYHPEFQRLVSNPAQIKRLGWQPDISLEKLAAMMVRYQTKESAAEVRLPTIIRNN